MESKPGLPAEGKANAWIGCVGLLMTAVFVSGISCARNAATSGLGWTPGSHCSSLPWACRDCWLSPADHPVAVAHRGVAAPPPAEVVAADFAAGLSVWALLVPQGLADANVAGVPVQDGFEGRCD
jgi:hypothetical protein